MGLRLSPEKTLITHIDEGLVFLGWRIQRHRKRGTGKHYIYIYPAKKALVAVTANVKTICRPSTNLPLEDLLHRLNRMLRAEKPTGRKAGTALRVDLTAVVAVGWKLAAARPRGTPGRVGAAQQSRAGFRTARWAGSGERDGKVCARNRCRYTS
jgi:hypothetical protein